VHKPGIVDEFLDKRAPSSASAPLERRRLASQSLQELRYVPGVGASSVQGIVPRRLAAISVRSAGSQTRTVLPLGEPDERCHRRGARSDDVVAVVARHRMEPYL
jgi:hypothetical protein